MVIRNWTLEECSLELRIERFSWAFTTRKIYTKPHPGPKMGNFRYRSLQCHFLTVICANSHLITRVKINTLLACVQPLPPCKKNGTSLSLIFLSGGSGCTQAIFYSLAGVVPKICCEYYASQWSAKPRKFPYIVQLPLWIIPLYSLYGKSHEKNLKYLKYFSPCLSLHEL